MKEIDQRLKVAILRVIRDILFFEPQGRATNHKAALDYLNRVQRRKAVVFLISDFLAPAKHYSRELLALSRRHDVIGVVLEDPREVTWPRAGLVGLQDAETETLHWVDSGSRRWRDAFQQRAGRFRAMRDRVLLRAGVDRIDVTVNEDYVQALTRFFHQRARRLMR